MIYISHRGNTHGKLPSAENRPDYIDEAIWFGYDVEIDIWCKNDYLFLGHDSPEYPLNISWLSERSDKLWIHCKNIEAVEWFYMNKGFHYFWHDEDDMTMTSNGIIWSHPKIQPLINSIAVLPDTYEWDLSKCMGICSDYIEKYK